MCVASANAAQTGVESVMDAVETASELCRSGIIAAVDAAENDVENFVELSLYLMSCAMNDVEDFELGVCLVSVLVVP